MVTPHEISLVLGLFASGLFCWKYRQYETQLEKEEMLHSFLDGGSFAEAGTPNR